MSEGQASAAGRAVPYRPGGVAMRCGAFVGHVPRDSCELGGNALRGKWRLGSRPTRSGHQRR